MKKFYLDEMQLEELTFSVYGRAIQMTHIEKGQTYEYEVQNFKTHRETLKQALTDGYIDSSLYGHILSDIYQKGMIAPATYVVRIL